ncbi:MAG: hypothetical protein VCA36_00120, partial [Opitutales bacterium]
LKSKLGQAQVEISLLKQAGAGETVGTETLAAQLQEAIATIQVLQHNLVESEKANTEVDDLRLRLAAVTEAKIDAMEREDADTDTLRKKLRTLEMELALANQAQSSDRVNAQQLFSKLKDELEASRNTVANLQQRMGQSDAGSVITIAELEEELARTKAEQSDAERRLHQLLQGKTETVAALERELVLTKSKIDQLEQNALGLKPSQSRIIALEQQLALTKAQLDDMNEQGGAGSVRAAELEKQLVDTQKQLNELLLVAQRGTTGGASPQVVVQLQTQLQEAHSAVTNLQSALAQRDKENAEIETQLEKALENMMDMQMAGDGTSLRRELDELKRQLTAAKSGAPGSVDGVPDASALANLKLEIEKLKSELIVARQVQPVDQATLAFLQKEIDQLKKDLNQARQDPSSASAEESRLQSELESATEKIFDLQTQLGASRKKIQDMSDLAVARGAGDEATVAELTDKIQQAIDAIRVLKADVAKSETEITKGKDDASALDQELQKSFLAMQQLKDERDDLSAERKTLVDRIVALEDLSSKLTAANRATFQATEADTQIKRERDNLIRTNLSLQIDLEKYKNEVRKLQESLASPSTSGSNAANLQAQVTALESQIQMAKAAETSALSDYDQVSANLKDALRQVRVLETNIAQAEGRIKQLEASSSTFGGGFSSPRSGENLTTKALRDELISLRAQLEASKAVGGSRSQTEDRLRDTSRKLLTSQGELERATRRIAILEDQANQKEVRRRSDVEREKAANQMVTLLNEKLKREEAKGLALQEGLRKLREVIATRRGEPSGLPIQPGIGSGVRPSMFDESLRPVRFPPRATLGSRSPPIRGLSTFSGVRPRPVPSRATFRDRRPPTESALPPVAESVPFRSSSPVGRTVIRGNAKVDFEAKVQFLDRQIKPASNVEFFLTKGLDIEDITARAGIPLPSGIHSAAELWARSIHRGYSYPGVAAKIRNALSAASVARFKTDAAGGARLENLTAGRYTVIGASPMGLIGVVWSEPIQMSNGTNVILDLRNSAFAK